MPTDLTLPSEYQVLSLINEENQMNLDFTHIEFGIPSALENDEDNKNTGLVVTSQPNGGYKGSVEVKYNRLDLSGFLQYGEPVLDIPVNGDLNDVITAFNEYYDANLNLGDDISTNIVLPTDMDYLGKSLVLQAAEESFAYIGSIDVTVKWSSQELSDVIAEGMLNGLEWPLVQGAVLEGNALRLSDGLADANHHVGLFDDNMYVIHGYNDISNIQAVRRYNFTTDTWHNVTYSGSLPSISTRRDGISATVDENIYLFYSGNMYVFNMITNTWTTGNQTPRSFINASCVAVDRDIYFFLSDESMWRYNTITEEWTQLSNVPSSSSLNIIKKGGAHYNGKIYAMRRYSTYVYDIGKDTWTVVGGGPLDLGSGTVTECQGYIYSFGGYGTRLYENLLRFDPATDTWFDYGDIGIPARRNHTCVNYQDSLYVYGGDTPSAGNTRKGDIFKIS